MSRALWLISWETLQSTPSSRVIFYYRKLILSPLSSEFPSGLSHWAKPETFVLASRGCCRMLKGSGCLQGCTLPGGPRGKLFSCSQEAYPHSLTCVRSTSASASVIPSPPLTLVCVCVLDAQLCLTLCDPVDCSLPGSSVHGILQARILQGVAISFFYLPLTRARLQWTHLNNPG